MDGTSGPNTLNPADQADGALRFRAIWLSDIHLGTRGCKAEILLDFLKHTESDILYLVGDIVDGWRLTRSWYWDQSHNDVIQKVLRKARKGTRIVYIPGNHDEVLRNYDGVVLGGIQVMNEVVHETADGRKLLIFHGDQFDGVVMYAKWLAILGDRAYNVCLEVNRWFNQFRRRLGYPYWSLSAYLKNKVKNAVEFVSGFEEAIAAEARRRGADGVVCGHIHKAETRMIDGVLYCNDGDWVESCTALVEHESGKIEVLRWTEIDRNGLAVKVAAPGDSSPLGADLHVGG